MIDVQVLMPKNLANTTNAKPDWSQQVSGLANVVGNAKIDYDTKTKQEELEKLLDEYSQYQQGDTNGLQYFDKAIKDIEDQIKAIRGE